MTREAKIKALMVTAATFGWVWLLSIPASAWFFLGALFSNSPWSRFFASFGIGFVCKSVLLGFEAHTKRVALEGALLARGIPADQARDLGFAAMNGGPDAFQRQVRQFGMTPSSLLAHGPDA